MSAPTHDVDGSPVGATRTVSLPLGDIVLTLCLSGVHTWNPTQEEIDAQYLVWRELPTAAQDAQRLAEIRANVDANIWRWQVTA